VQRIIEQHLREREEGGKVTGEEEEGEKRRERGVLFVKTEFLYQRFPTAQGR